MKFAEWLVLKEEPMRAVGSPVSNPQVGGSPQMSKVGFGTSGNLGHGQYKPKNFDRYAFSPDEQKVQQYSQKMGQAIRNDVLIGTEALAGFYKNDAIVKALDDYLTSLRDLGIKV